MGDHGKYLAYGDSMPSSGGDFPEKAVKIPLFWRGSNICLQRRFWCRHFGMGRTNQTRIRSPQTPSAHAQPAEFQVPATLALPQSADVTHT
nr:hypothetical protein [uncultured Pseudomonas sp.]